MSTEAFLQYFVAVNQAYVSFDDRFRGDSLTPLAHRLNGGNIQNRRSCVAWRTSLIESLYDDLQRGHYVDNKFHPSNDTTRQFNGMTMKPSSKFQISSGPEYIAKQKEVTHDKREK